MYNGSSFRFIGEYEQDTRQTPRALRQLSTSNTVFEHHARFLLLSIKKQYVKLINGNVTRPFSESLSSRNGLVWKAKVQDFIARKLKRLVCQCQRVVS